MSQSKSIYANFDRSDKAADATTIAKIRPKLTNEQQQWMDGLPEEARGMVERVLWQSGEGYFLQHWAFLRDQMEYVLTLL